MKVELVDIEEDFIPKGIYKIDINGNIFSCRYNLFMKPNVDRDGYLIIHFRYKGKRIVRKIHRLVLKYFYKNSNLDVNHIDGNKKNNHISNLEYVTKSENMIHAVANNLNTNCKLKGENHNTSKHSFDKISKIRKLRSEGLKYKEISKYMGGLSLGYISDVVNYKIRKEI